MPVCTLLTPTFDKHVRVRRSEADPVLVTAMRPQNDRDDHLTRLTEFVRVARLCLTNTLLVSSHHASRATRYLPGATHIPIPWRRVVETEPCWEYLRSGVGRCQSWPYRYGWDSLFFGTSEGCWNLSEVPRFLSFPPFADRTRQGQIYAILQQV